MDFDVIITIIILVAAMLFPLLIQFIPSWIGNKDAFDFNYTFNKAITYVGDERVELDIENWTDYEGEQIQIVTPDGKVYLVSGLNTMLIGE